MEVRNRAKALTDAELKTQLDEGVTDGLDVIQTPELRVAYKAIVMEALRQERAERSAAARRGDVASNTGRPGVPRRPMRQPEPPPVRGGGPQAVPVRVPEPGFNLIYNGQSFEGWEGRIGLNLPPAKKGMPKGGGFYYKECPALTVAHRVGNTIVSKPVIGILSTDKLFQVNSFKFDYMLATAGGRPLPKARNAHAVAEFSLDKPMNLGNMNSCSFIEVSLVPEGAGEMRTRRSRNRDVATQPAAANAGHQNGEWNEMEIKCGERSIEVLINGVEVNRLETPRRITARIAFSFGGVELHLANLRKR